MAILRRKTATNESEKQKTKENSMHDMLCKSALSWLYNHMKCQLAVSELNYCCERPDAIGWRWSKTILIECKSSRADFLRDKNKYARKNTKGLGNYRFYLCPPGIIKPEDLPPKWGLLYQEGKRIRKIVCPAGNYLGTRYWDDFYFEAEKELEILMLVNIAKRLKNERCNRIWDMVGCESTSKLGGV